MFLKSAFFRAAGVLCLALTITVFAFGDTIRLKDGSIIKGRIISFSGGQFTILIGDGTRQKQLNYSASEIQSIAFDNDSKPVANTAAPANNNSTQNNKNSTIITVGQTGAKTSPPPTASPKVIAPVANTTVAQIPKPIEVGVKVLADNTANGWTNSGWVVKQGQKIKITGSGRVSLGGGRYATPSGITSLPDKDKLMPNKATGGLIAVIGDNNNDFIFVGDAMEFTAAKDGALFLGVNEGNLSDNSGSFDIKIEISSEKGF